jgi:hypothetical protein
MRRILFVFSLLVMQFLNGRASGQNYDPWGWWVLTGQGCYVPGEGPSREMCMDKWVSYLRERPIPSNGIGCEGTCTVLKCDDNAGMHFEKKGADLHAETPPVKAANSAANPGNLLRKRFLKCRKLGRCWCEFNPPSGYLCKLDSNSVSYDSMGAFQGDLGGPACPPPQQGGPPPGYTPGGQTPGTGGPPTGYTPPGSGGPPPGYTPSGSGGPPLGYTPPGFGGSPPGYISGNEDLGSYSGDIPLGNGEVFNADLSGGEYDDGTEDYNVDNFDVGGDFGGGE